MIKYRQAYPAALVAALAIAHIEVGSGQQAPNADAVAEWARLAELPDLTTGVWSNDRPGTLPAGLAADAPPLVEGASRSESHVESCVPIGVPTVMHRPYPFEFVLEPGRMLMLLEFDGMTRRIFTDGRAHPEDPDLTYAGHSIGHWEEDTLVVDTIGFLPEVRVTSEVIAGGPMRVMERMSLASADVLRIETTITAPNALREPWTYTREYLRRTDWTVNEYYCVQNPRAILDGGSEPLPDLTPP